MKMHKIEVYVIDFEDSGVEECMNLIEENQDIMCKVVHTETIDIGEWNDDHELNQNSSGPEIYRKYFNQEA